MSWKLKRPHCHHIRAVSSVLSLSLPNQLWWGFTRRNNGEVPLHDHVCTRPSELVPGWSSASLRSPPKCRKAAEKKKVAILIIEKHPLNFVACPTPDRSISIEPRLQPTLSTDRPRTYCRRQPAYTQWHHLKRGSKSMTISSGRILMRIRLRVWHSLPGLLVIRRACCIRTAPPCCTATPSASATASISARLTRPW